MCERIVQAKIVRARELRRQLTVQDKILKCRDCGQEFVFTSGEQDFFAQKGFSEPSRCSACRAARKSSRGEGGFTSSREREMYPAVCAQCGKPTQVPFEPRGDRPVYCSDCFSTQRPGGGGQGRRNGSGRDGGYDDRGRGRDRQSRGGDRYNDRYNDRW
jgi:CxxC-x17-CxxC domain-containing protein